MKVEDLIADENVVITVSHGGYIKRLPMDTYQKQRRGGKGVTGATSRDEDFTQNLYTASTHDYLMMFTSIGKLHLMKVYEIPEASRYAKGAALAGLLKIAEGETITGILAVKNFDPKQWVIMATKNGLVKKTSLQQFDKPRAGGILAITLDKGDSLVSAEITDGKKDILLATRQGKSIRFAEKQVREVGRAGQGRSRHSPRIRPILWSGMQVVADDRCLLTSTERGFGKRTKLGVYRRQSRGGKGILNIKTTAKNGQVVSVLSVADHEEIIAVTASGKVIRQRVKEIKPTGRLAQGVRLIKLDADDRLSSVVTVPQEEDEGGSKT
jgi:DNA gyrase subunit A